MQQLLRKPRGFSGTGGGKESRTDLSGKTQMWSTGVVCEASVLASVKRSSLDSVRCNFLPSRRRIDRLDFGVRIDADRLRRPENRLDAEDRVPRIVDVLA